MFFISFSVLWSFSYFFIYIYVITVFNLILYSLYSIKESLLNNKFKKTSNFDYLSGFDTYWIFLTPLLLLLIINFSWSSPALSAWFGNTIFTSFQYKFTFLVIFTYTLILLTYSSSFYLSSKEIFDYVIVCFNFLFWVIFLFFSNSIFTFIFFVEVLSTLIFLLLTVSTFSTTYFYNNLNLNLHNYFNSTTPVFFVQMLLYFFWISLVSSLNLFFFLILFYLKFVTFDWFFFEHIFNFIINFCTVKDLFFIVLIWFNLLFCVFLKCGLVPFYFWKPIFFKGMPVHALFFYILFFYFFIFLFFLTTLLVYLNEIFYFFIGINICMLLTGFFILLFILCESYYIKAFLALSSILNTLFVFLALNGTTVFDFFFFL